ncbi:hypothetical protein JOF56_005747 [Kibdelosporangium banguiense]|uniref:Uncharacterized protein n=1 Tax=Kibdelosporangium banguiense TaxID=1365924 RepID=A0ABS4TLT0_9PSEU|nr:hypothetical protein [Kibdelosporangium banguiense]MBP2325362.1 hypothetical protein [Kibdelosporangium banguiense]
MDQAMESAVEVDTVVTDMAWIVRRDRVIAALTGTTLWAHGMPGRCADWQDQ